MCGAVTLARVDHLLGFGAELFLHNGDDTTRRQQRLEHLVLIGIDGALHHVLAEPPGGIDEYDPVEPRLGVDREHDAGPAQIRTDHELHPDRERDFHVIEALDLPVADGAVGEERGVAAPASVEQHRFAANVEVALLLAGEARLGQILCRCA